MCPSARVEETQDPSTRAEAVPCPSTRAEACYPGVQSHSRIDLLEDVSFGNIGRHEVNCKAGVQETKNTQPLVEVSRE